MRQSRRLLPPAMFPNLTLLTCAAAQLGSVTVLPGPPGISVAWAILEIGPCAMLVSGTHEALTPPPASRRLGSAGEPARPRLALSASLPCASSPPQLPHTHPIGNEIDYTISGSKLKGELNSTVTLAPLASAGHQQRCMPAVPSTSRLQIIEQVARPRPMRPL